jgi:hypothetical protein
MLPKVKRSVPLNKSTPTVEIRSPSAIEMNPLMGDLPVTVMTSSSPKTIRHANSGGPKATANLAMIGARKVRAMTPTVLATKPEIADIPMAGPARPFRASWCPS